MGRVQRLENEIKLLRKIRDLEREIADLRNQYRYPWGWYTLTYPCGNYHLIKYTGGGSAFDTYTTGSSSSDGLTFTGISDAVSSNSSDASYTIHIDPDSLGYSWTIE